jgi:3-oxoacyl-[acyl-carrier-protein] synthase-3
MSYIRSFGCYLPERVVTNDEIAALVGVDAAWVLRATGIAARRFAAAEESVASLAVRAGKDCLANAEITARQISMVLVASGSGERRFPGPAAAVAAGIGIPGVPAIDLPMASAGSLFGLALAARLSADYGNVLVIASEIMSRVIRLDATGRDTAVLFGDGAGACLVSREAGPLEIVDSLLASDGELCEALRLDFDCPLYMDGRSIILHASRKLPRAISELLEKHHIQPQDVGAFLLHQANLNLITRVAQAVGAPDSRFFRNVERYGNTSSASMLIAAAEWWRECGAQPSAPVVFAAFGAGLHWGAALCVPSARAV